MPTQNDEAINIGWDILDRCRAHADKAAREGVEHPNPELHRRWHPLSIGHGDLGIALVLATAAELDPDGGWDRAAHRHVSRTIATYRTTPDLHIGLLAGISGVAWCLRALSREGERYQTALHNVEAHLAQRMSETIIRLQRSGSVPVASFDMASGLAGAVTYSMVCGGESLLPLVEEAINVFATRALDMEDDAYWTASGQIPEATRRLNPELAGGYRDLGTAHGVVGILHVLGQAADRGLGGQRAAEAALLLADQVLEEGRTAQGRIDVPYFVYPPSASSEGRNRTKSPTRHAWCYGNLGVSVAFANSSTLKHARPSAIDQLLPRPELQRAGLSDVGLCHGWAGALLLERHVLSDSSYDGALGGLLNLLREEEVFGFSEQIGGLRCQSSPGYLEESGGAAATLAALARPATAQPLALQMLSGAWR